MTTASIKCRSMLVPKKRAESTPVRMTLVAVASERAARASRGASGRARGGREGERHARVRRIASCGVVLTAFEHAVGIFEHRRDD